MNDQETPRFALPYLFTSQAQKELTHNEALVAIDTLLHPVIEGVMNTPIPSLNAADAGKCWRVGSAPTGLWLNHSGQIASWTGDGWRYVIPSDGMQVFNQANGAFSIYRSSTWSEAIAITDPINGNNVDVEARAAISSILTFLRENALIPS
jgi:hypothetical protein